MIALAAGFFLTALLYASVGFGGGSTYSALLALAGTDYRLLPIISLACNIVVVTGGTLRFSGAGAVPWRRALVLSAIGAPAALLGGLTPIRQELFMLLLGLCLLAAALLLLLPRASDAAPPRERAGVPAMLAAAPLGYLAGVVGIGGGIFLAPLLHLLRWEGARRIAGTTSLFILINSVSGLVGQLGKSGIEAFGGALGGALPLLVAVVVGGQIGSAMALRFFPERLIRLVTAALIAWVGLRLLLG